MSMKPFKDLISRKEAVRVILEKIQPVNAVECITLQDTVGRVLSRDIIAEFDVPPFDRASMDGYAVRSEDTNKASKELPITLKLIGEQHTGSIFNGIIVRGECLEIATGSPMPKGADAVVMVEYTERDGNNVIIKQSVTPGKNMAPAGEDMVKGTKVLEKDTTVTPGVLGALAALGYSEVDVYVKPRIAIYSSGPEIVPQGKKLKTGQIYDINSYTLASIIELNGGKAIKCGIIEDDMDSILNSFKEISKYDLAVYSGGSSVGVKDLFSEAVQKKGEIYFHGVKTKPGKPTLFGRVSNIPIFGMPGYPTSCLNNSYIYLMPGLRKMARLQPKHWVAVKVPIGHDFESKGDREQFITIKLTDEVANVVFKQSGDITSMTHADGFIILPEGYNRIKKGETIEVTLLNI